MENNRLEAKLKRYIAALKEETEKRSEAVDMVQILQTTKDAESKIEILMEKLIVTENYDEPNEKNSNIWVAKGKSGGFKGNNKPHEFSQTKNFLVECPPCGREFNEREIEKHIEKHHLEVKTVCDICETEVGEGKLEEHTSTNHKMEVHHCEKCPKTYTSTDHMKRHIWRAHTPIECSLCGTNIESRQGLKHHKEYIHKVTKSFECKHAKEGKCMDGEECLFSHYVKDIEVNDQQQEQINESASNVKCTKCPKTYDTDFKVKRHEWRSHEEVDCRLCGQASQSRQVLENHKQLCHGITKNRECTFWASGKCVDGVECLFSHEAQKHKSDRLHKKDQNKKGGESSSPEFCKKGLKCDRNCGLSDSRHKRVK